MTTVATRARRIAEFEGFDIIVKIEDTPVEIRDSGLIGSYPYEKAAVNKWTVGDWKAKRFEANYEGFTADVLMGCGKIAKANTTLEDVRSSYYDE